MSPTYAASSRARREFRRLTPKQQRAFMNAVGRLVECLRASPPQLDPALRVKRVQGHVDVWELSWAPDGRATFVYGAELKAGDPHVIWRRIGDHSILREP